MSICLKCYRLHESKNFSDICDNCWKEIDIKFPGQEVAALRIIDDYNIKEAKALVDGCWKSL